MRSRQDEPAAIDASEIIANAKAGRMFCATGPFLEVTTADGQGPGETVASPGPVALQVRVQCNTWTDINRVAVLVNGRIDPQLDLRRSTHPDKFRDAVVRFEQTLTVKPERDAHLIVVAAGEGLDLHTCYGDGWQSSLAPIAFHNPIYVDVDGDGFRPNGDMLDQPFLQNR